MLPLHGVGAMPADLAAIARRRRIHVVGGTDVAPVVEITRARADGDSADERHWHIDIDLCDGQTQDGPDIRAMRADASVYRAAIDPNVGFRGHRPAWMDLSFFPKAASPRNRPSMRRISGGSTRPNAFDRRLYHDASYPWGCIGRVSTHDANGSGVLVGRNLVVTAGHVVPWDTRGAVRFDTNHFGTHGVSAQAIEARGFDTALTGYDWAILRLDRPLGDIVGFMGYNDYLNRWEDRAYWNIVGFPEGLGPFYQSGISIHDDDEDDNDGQELESQNADTIDGDSGAPLFGFWKDDPRVVGVVSGVASEHNPGYEENHVMAGGPGLSALIAWGRTNW